MLQEDCVVMQSPAAPLPPRASPATLVAEVREDAREERVGRSLAEERALAERRLRPRRWRLTRNLRIPGDPRR